MAIHNAKLNPSFMNKILSNGVKLYADKNTTARERNIADCYAKVTRKGISWLANKKMHLVQDVNQVLTVLAVYMINERINYEYRIAY